MTRSQYDVKYYNPFKHLNPVATFRQAPGGTYLYIVRPVVAHARCLSGSHK